MTVKRKTADDFSKAAPGRSGVLSPSVKDKGKKRSKKTDEEEDTLSADDDQSADMEEDIQEFDADVELPDSSVKSAVRKKTSDDNIEDSDSLKIYYRHLGDSEPLSAEDEYALWQRIEDSLNEIRRHLYRMGFVLLEHAKLIEASTEENIDDLFQQSALSADARNMNKSSFFFMQIRPWAEAISGAYQNLEAAYIKGDQALLDAERAKVYDLLMCYPVHSDLLSEWYRNAGVMLMSAEISRDETLPAAVSKAKIKELESRLLMPLSEFAESMKTLEECFQRIEDDHNKILVANLRLVVSIVRHYRNSNVQTGDLIQEGNLGLIHAMEKFDFRLGHKFSTYATWWIKQSISKAVANQSRVIRLPLHMLQSISKINKAEQNFILLNGRDPTDEELAAALELPRERVSAIKKMACQAISLQAPLSNSDGSFVENLVSEGEAGDPAKKLAFKMMCDRLTNALGTLSEREQQIIKLRFGLVDGKPMTLVEVSKMFQLTRERIRQLEYKAIKKLRDPALMVYFQDYFS